MNLHEYDIIIINSSAEKDSLASMYQIHAMGKQQKFSMDKIVVSHQDLGESEWKGTKDLVKTQAKYFGLKVYCSKRKDKNGKEETLLQYVERRKKWPSNKQRYCTSDFKRGPGGRIVTMLTKDLGNCKVLYVFGFRKDESPARSKKEVLVLNKKLTTKKRQVFDYLPIHDWPISKVWGVIKKNNLPYHRAYDFGMPRLSCVFCIFSPFDALVIAGKANPKLLAKYVNVEKRIGHDFQKDKPLLKVKQAIEAGYEPTKIKDWVM